MNLLLWRHADAEDSEPDASRMLTKRGHAQAEKVAAWIQRELPAHARILVSPATRARQTAQALGMPFVIDDTLAPGASVEAVLATLDLPRAERILKRTVVVVGHQPWLGELAAYLLSGSPAPYSVRKAALWWLTQRERASSVEWTLRCVVDPDLV